LRLVIDGIPGLVHTTTAEGELEFVNQQFLDYFGKTLDELKGWATNDVIHPDDLSLANWYGVKVQRNVTLSPKQNNNSPTTRVGNQIGLLVVLRKANGLHNQSQERTGGKT
jgi:PAS domain-containing protein